MRVHGRSLKMSGDRGANSDLINLARKMYIHKKSRENLPDEKIQETPSAGVESNFFKSGEKKSEGLENISSTSPVPAA